MSGKDWCVVGATVRNMTGCLVTIEEVTTDDGVWSRGGNNYCRTELTPLSNGLNGYRYGVEYETNGVRPDLPRHIIVSVKNKGVWLEPDFLSERSWLNKDNTSFKITDERYTPAATKPTEQVNDWYDYTNQKALRLPPVGVECELSYTAKENWLKCIYRGKTRIDTHIVEWIGGGVDSFGGLTRFRPLDWNRKAEAERKRVVDAAYQAIGASGTTSYAALDAAYAVGFLRIPEDN